MSCSSSSGSEEDDEGFESYRKGGYHAVRVADHFSGGRYIAQRKLGWGQFSTVWLAYDTTTSVCSFSFHVLDFKVFLFFYVIVCYVMFI
jgi:serine/threonine-protein kinase SRPK3